MKDHTYASQNKLYGFPYHYVPEMDGDAPSIARAVPWGLQYLAYMQHVIEAIVEQKPQSLLDVGCGDGRLLSLLPKEIPVRAGIDISEEAIGFARAFVREAHTQVGTLESVSERYEMVACVETLEHIPDESVASFIVALRRVIPLGGSLIVTVPSVVLPLSRKHHRHYTEELITKQLSPYFQVSEVRHLIKNTLLAKVIRRLLINRFFIVTWRPWRAVLWKLYVRNCVMARPGRGEHIFVLCHAV